MGGGRSSDTSQEILPQNFKEDFILDKDFRCFGVFSTTNPSTLNTWILLPNSETFDQFSLTSIGDGKYVITDKRPEKYAYAPIIDAYHGNLIIKLTDQVLGALVKSTQIGENFVVIWKDDNKILMQPFEPHGNKIGEKEVLHTVLLQSIHHLSVHTHNNSYVTSWMESTCKHADKIDCDYEDNSSWGYDLSSLTTNIYMEINILNHYTTAPYDIQHLWHT